MIKEKITSLEFYLDFPAGHILEVKSIEDVGAGMYPCYYMKTNGTLKISTSVTALVLDSKTFVHNKNFKPPDFLKTPLLKKLFGSFMWRVNKLHRLLSLGIFQINKSWYESFQTIDKRIKKLRPFEIVSADSSQTTFKPDYTLNNEEELIDKSVYYLKKFVNDVEMKYPDFDHIILTGGRDSQLIALIPKKNKNKWHIFSADPNFPLVKDWVEKNNLGINRMFRHDNRNEETGEDIKKKIICCDLYSDLIHIRWLPGLKKIAEKFDRKCIFWTGTAADSVYGYNEVFRKHFSKGYFDIHLTRVCPRQGNYHQTFKNFVDCPLLSPYHSQEIWRDLYQHYNPIVIKKGSDLRDRIGDKLHCGQVTYPPQNPGPVPYSYNTYIDVYKYYLSYINEHIK